MFDSDFAENENKLDIIKTSHRVEIEKSILRGLHTDFKLKLISKMDLPNTDEERPLTAKGTRTENLTTNKGKK